MVQPRSAVVRRLGALAALLLGGAAAFRKQVSSHLEGLEADHQEALAAKDGAVEATQSFGNISNLVVLSWNAQDFDDDQHQGRVDPGTKLKRMNTRLQQEVAAPGRPQANIVFLQEVESCDMVRPFLSQMPTFDCVESHIDRAYEEKSALVLGNILLYDAALFQVWSKNRGVTEGWQKWRGLHSKILDKNGETLADVHQEMCTDPATGWKSLHGKNACNIDSDTQPSNSALLTLQAGKWSAAATEAFGTGVNLVNIHLFSGGGAGNMNPLDLKRNDARRAFQFRSFLWRTHIWQGEDQAASWAPYSTIYAGDFNVGDAAALKKVTYEQGNDFWVDLWCPLEGKACKSVLDSDTLATQGRGSYKKPLDHVVMDTRGVPSNRTLVSKAWVSSIDYDYSDHAPLVVCIAPSGAEACGLGSGAPAPPAATSTTKTAPASPAVTSTTKIAPRLR